MRRTLRVEQNLPASPETPQESGNVSGGPRYDPSSPGTSSTVTTEGSTPRSDATTTNVAVLCKEGQSKGISSPFHALNHGANQGRDDIRESRRRRLQEIEHEMQMLRDAEDENGSAAIAEHPNHGGTGGTHYPEFAGWVKSFEESLRRIYPAGKALTQGQIPGGNDLGQRAAAEQAQLPQPSPAIASTYATLPSQRMHPHATQTLPHATHSHSAHTIQTHPTYTSHTHSAHTILPQHEYVQPHFNTSTLSQSQIAARQPVPRDLPIFSGEPEAWSFFIATYNRTNTACGYTDDENIGRLQYALRGAAFEAVGHLLSFPDGLNEVMATLKARFGRPDLIVESMTEKIRKMAPPKIERLSTVVEFGYAVKRLVGTMTASGLRGYMYDVALLKELVRKLPPVLCIDWARTRSKLSEVTLLEFGKWVGDLAEDLCGVVDVMSIMDNSDSTHQQPEPPTHHSRTQPQRFQPHRAPPAQLDRRPPIRTGRVHLAYCNATVLQDENLGDPSSSQNTPELLTVCPLCGRDCPTLVQCEQFQRTTVAARRSFVGERRICRKCLGYHRGGCSVRAPCAVNGCNRQHHELLHVNDQTPASPHQRDHLNGSGKVVYTGVANVLTHSGPKDSSLLKYVPVTLHGPRGRIDTFAFLDDGSTSTFMEHGLAQELGVTGTPYPLCLQWTGDVTREEQDSVRLSVRISGRNMSHAIYKLSEVHTVKELALPEQSVNVAQLTARYTHLRDLQFESYASAVPRILIGIDNCNITRTLKTVDASCNEPVASKTRLGWVVYGPCSVASAKPSPSNRSFSGRPFHDLSCNSASDKAVRPLRPRDDERALAILERETNGQRYEMGPLWRYDSVNLPYNKKAFKRDGFLKQKMAKYSKLANDVNRTNVAEFLPTLHHRTERSEPVRPTEIGDIVVVACNNS